MSGVPHEPVSVGSAMTLRPTVDRDDASADQVLRAVVDPRRREILRLVAHHELPAGEIAATFDITRTAVSQHLTVLKQAGLLRERRDGTRRFYRVQPNGLNELRRFLDEIWADSLDSARQIIEAEAGIGEDDHRAATG